MKPLSTNTFWWVFLTYCLCLGCASDPAINREPFPAAEQISITWEVLDDAISGDDKRTLQFTLRNDSDTLLPRSGWKLYFNQFPHALYVDDSYSDEYSIANEGGDLYSITPQDSFPELGREESYEIRYQTNFGIFRYTFGPKSPFIVLEDKTVVPIEISR